MGEKEGTAPSRTKKPSLNTHKEAQATADAQVRSLFATTMVAAPPATWHYPHNNNNNNNNDGALHRYVRGALRRDLQGRYDLLLAPYDPASGRSHQQLLHRLLSMSDTSPKAFMGLVEHSGSYCMVLVHIGSLSSRVIQLTRRIGMARC